MPHTVDVTSAFYCLAFLLKREFENLRLVKREEESLWERKAVQEVAGVPASCRDRKPSQKRTTP